MSKVGAGLQSDAFQDVTDVLLSLETGTHGHCDRARTRAVTLLSGLFLGGLVAGLAWSDLHAVPGALLFNHASKVLSR
jgi:hypothetical protein